MEPESDLVATREMVMNLLEATWETAESMSSQSSSSDSSSSSDDDEAAVAQSTSDRQYAIAHLTELLQLVQRRSKARDSAAAAATLHPAASLTATPSRSLRPCWSHSDVPSMALAEESSFEKVARMRRSYQVQAVACHSSSFDINREGPTGDVCSLLDQVSNATIISSRAIYNDACVVCGLSDKGSYTKMGFKCHNCIPLVDVVDSPLYMRYNPSAGEALFADTATGSGLLTRTSSGTVVRTPSLQRRITYQQGSVLSSSSQRLSLSTSNRPRSPSIGSVNSITAGGGGNSSKNRFLSRSDFSESHQDPTNFQMTEIEREVGAIEGTLKAHYRNRCVHPLNGGMIIEEVGGDGQPSGGPPSKVKNVSFEGLPTFLQIQSVAGDGDQGDEGVPARHMHSEWESTWDNPVRGNDFIRSIPCVRLTNQYDQYGLSFLRCYQSEAERSTRLATSKPTSADTRDAFLSLFRNCSTGSVFVSPSSPAPSPKTLKADAKRDPQSWSTSMYTHVVPHLFTEASAGDVVQGVPSGRMGRYMTVKRSGLCATALSNDTLLEGSPLLSSMLLGTSQRPTPTAVNNSGGSRSSFPPTTTAETTATPIHDLHGLVHPNLLYIFAVAPHAASNSTWYVLENLPSLMDYRIVKQRLSNTLSSFTTAAATSSHRHHTCSQDTSPLDNKRAPSPTHTLGRLRSIVSNVIVKRHTSSLSSGTTSFRNVVQTVMSHIVSKSADEEFKALAFGSISAIQAIHKAGFVHGDLRPHNFFVDPTTGSVKIRFCPSYERLPPPFCPPEATIAATTAPFKPTPEGDMYTLGITLRLLRFGTADESGYPPQDVMLEGDRQLIIMLQSMTDPMPSARPSPASLLETGPLWVVRTVEGIPAVRKHLSMSILSYHDQLAYATAQFKRMGQSSPQSSFALVVSSRSNSPSFPTALAAEPTKEFKMPTESKLYLRDSTVSTTTFDNSPLVDDDTDAHSAMQDSFNKSFGGSFANLSAYRRISSQRGLNQGKSESMGNSPSLGVSMDESTQDDGADAVLSNQLQQVVLPLSALSTQHPGSQLAVVPTHSSSAVSSGSGSGSGHWYQDPAAVAAAPVFILRNVASKGAQELLKFFAVCGPSYHAVRGRDGFLSLYSVAKDPRVSKE